MGGNASEVSVTQHQQRRRSWRPPSAPLCSHTHTVGGAPGTSAPTVTHVDSHTSLVRSTTNTSHDHDSHPMRRTPNGTLHAKVTQHWACQAPQTSRTTSGHSQRNGRSRHVTRQPIGSCITDAPLAADFRLAHLSKARRRRRGKRAAGGQPPSSAMSHEQRQHQSKLPLTRKCRIMHCPAHWLCGPRRTREAPRALMAAVTATNQQAISNLRLC